MRLFASLALPDPVAEHLDTAVRWVHAGVPTALAGTGRPAVRWVPVGQRHITLAFYGEVPTGAVDDLTAGISSAVVETPRLTLRLRGAGVFTGRTLWAGVQDQTVHPAGLHSQASSPLVDLMQQTEIVGTRFTAGAVQQRDRRRAHVTVARSRDRRRGPEQLERMAEALSVYEGPSWRACELLLVQSELGQGPSGGPLYTTVAEIPLGG